MFETLDEKIKHDEKSETSAKERIVKGIMVAVISTALFGGLYFVVRVLE